MAGLWVQLPATKLLKAKTRFETLINSESSPKEILACFAALQNASHLLWESSIISCGRSIIGFICVDISRPLQNVPFCPIPASGSYFNPQNTKCIPVVKIFALTRGVHAPRPCGQLDGCPILLSCRIALALNKIEHFSKVSFHNRQYPMPCCPKDVLGYQQYHIFDTIIKTV
jgi:hypothetical protein